jgi:hypothetical protein
MAGASTERSSMHSSVSQQRLSRETLLKRAGAGAILFGAGSVVTATPAFAGTSAINAPANTRCASHVEAGGHCAACDTSACCGPGGPSDCSCTCVVTTKGCCFCHQGTSCNQPACRNNRDCPRGWQCITATCCGTQNMCFPPCGTTPAAAGEGPFSTPS